MSSSCSHSDGVAFFGISVAELLPRDDARFAVVQWRHRIMAYMMLAVVGLHVAGLEKCRCFDKQAESDALPPMLWVTVARSGGAIRQVRVIFMRADTDIFDNSGIQAWSIKKEFRMPYVIHGATGAQGAPLHALLLASHQTALAAVRDPANANGMPAVWVDNASVESLIAAYGDADGVFVHLPQTAETVRLQHANNIVKAIAAAKPKRVVISTSGAIVDQPGSALQAIGDSAIGTLLRGVADSGVSHAAIAPRFYLENLLLPMVVGPVQSEGLLSYPLRADFSASWSSHLDVAVVAERLLTDHSVTGVVGVGQLPGLTGPDLALAFSQHLGRSVRFEALSPERFGTLLKPLIGPAAADIAGFYEALSHAPDDLIASDTSAQHQLGLTPRTMGQWLADMDM